MIRRTTAGLTFALVVFPGLPLGAQEADVASTLHNLSVSGPGEIKSQNETEICKFCHIPHNAVVPRPLWGHALSQVEYYETPRLRRQGNLSVTTPQPGGSSRLCLSCHDGTVALGEIAGLEQPEAMAGAQRLSSGRKGYLGIDLSGSHPVSFKVQKGGPGDWDSSRDMGLRPLSAIRSDEQVRLDQKGYMQCTTCHNPHSDRFYQPDRVPRFWVKPTIDEVCLTCHALR